MNNHSKGIHILNILFTAVTLALPITTVCLAFTQMIYSDNHLENFIPILAGLIIIAASFFLIITSLFSQFPTAIGFPQSESLPIILLMVDSIVTHIPNADAILPNVLIAIALATCLTGLFFLVIGKFNLGNYIRLVPFAVVAGFIASTGWLVILAALSNASENFIFDSFHSLTDSLFLASIIPTLLFGVALFSVTKLFRSPFMIPGILVGGVVVFYLIILVMNIPLETLRNNDLLFPPILSDGFTAISSISYHEIDWSLIFDQVEEMGVIALISTLAVLFISSALELSLKKDINLNRELVSLGMGNVFIGLMFSIPNYPSLALSTLNKEMRANSRWVGIVCSVICLMTVFYGKYLIPYVPKFLLNGLILFLGMNIFTGWTISIRKKLTITDKIIILCIFIVVNILGIMEGILFGIIMSIVFFVINYSRISPIKYILTGLELHSKKQRNPVAQQIILNHGESMLFFKLQNYLFFGSANNILEILYKRITASKAKIDYIIYDFEYVNGIDSSLRIIFEKIKQYTQSKSITLIFTGLNKKIYHAMRSIDILNKNDFSYLIILNTDKALEKYEDLILEKEKYDFPTKIGAEEILTDSSINKEMVLTMMTYFDEIKLNKGNFLFHKNDPSNNLYYLESGYLTILSGANHEKNRRLSTIGPGNMVGEIGFYLKTPRTASIIAEEDCLLRFISPENFIKMHRENPIIATYFNKIIIRFLSNKLIVMNEELNILDGSKVV